MASIVKNTTGSLKTWGGVEVAGNSQYTLQPNDITKFLIDHTFKDDLEAGHAVINDGTADLGTVDAVLWLQGYLPPLMGIVGPDGTQVGVTNDNRIKMDVQISGNQLIKVSSNDQTFGYLEQKLTGISGETTADVLDEGGAEVRRIGLPDVGTAGTKGSATSVPVFTTDSKGRVISSVDTAIVGVPATYTGLNGVSTIQTTSTTYVVITGMTVTPAAGTYLVFAGANTSATSNNRLISVALGINGVVNTDTETFFFMRSSSGLLSSSSDIGTHAIGDVVTVNGSQSVDLLWKTSGGTAQVGHRYLYLIKVG